MLTSTSNPSLPDAFFLDGLVEIRFRPHPAVIHFPRGCGNGNGYRLSDVSHQGTLRDSEVSQFSPEVSPTLDWRNGPAGGASVRRMSMIPSETQRHTSTSFTLPLLNTARQLMSQGTAPSHSTWHLSTK